MFVWLLVAPVSPAIWVGVGVPVGAAEGEVGARVGATDVLVGWGKAVAVGNTTAVMVMVVGTTTLGVLQASAAKIRRVVDSANRVEQWNDMVTSWCKCRCSSLRSSFSVFGRGADYIHRRPNCQTA
jgi:hypothetical protein